MRKHRTLHAMQNACHKFHQHAYDMREFISLMPYAYELRNSKLTCHAIISGAYIPNGFYLSSDGYDVDYHRTRWGTQGDSLCVVGHIDLNPFRVLWREGNKKT